MLNYPPPRWRRVATRGTVASACGALLILLARQAPFLLPQGHPSQALVSVLRKVADDESKPTKERWEAWQSLLAHDPTGGLHPNDPDFARQWPGGIFPSCHSTTCFSFNEEVEMIAKLLQLQAGDTYCEVGAATGLFAIHLARGGSPDHPGGLGHAAFMHEEAGTHGARLILTVGTYEEVRLAKHAGPIANARPRIYPNSFTGVRAFHCAALITREQAEGCRSLADLERAPWQRHELGLTPRRQLRRPPMSDGLPRAHTPAAVSRMPLSLALQGLARLRLLPSFLPAQQPLARAT
jgi:hypothetical protein